MFGGEDPTFPAFRYFGLARVPTAPFGSKLVKATDMRSPHCAFALFAVAIAGSTSGCGGTQHVALLSAAGIPVTSSPAGAIPLEVVTRGTAVPDPLPVRGTSVVYGDLEAALGLAVSSAGVPWAQAHREKRADGWQLFVELTRAEAEEQHERLIVTLDVRATLRGRAGNVYLAQTSAHCRQAGLVEAASGGPVVYACMTRIGRDLTSWLSAVQP